MTTLLLLTLLLTTKAEGTVIAQGETRLLVASEETCRNLVSYLDWAQRKSEGYVPWRLNVMATCEAIIQ